jgi:hypothetical protein
MEGKKRIPRMMTIREIAKTGLLPENALRTMVKDGRAPHIMVGNKAMINYGSICSIIEETFYFIILSLFLSYINITYRIS